MKHPRKGMKVLHQFFPFTSGNASAQLESFPDKPILKTFLQVYQFDFIDWWVFSLSSQLLQKVMLKMMSD